ncbi:serine/threonine protein kinase SRPK1 [Tanacetum coccineum]
MHNDIMAAGSKDRPPMLATGRYAQWNSRFMIYVDTKPNSKELKQFILKGPYVMTEVTVPTQPATKNAPAILAHKVPKTYKSISSKNRVYFGLETEAIHMILSGIGDDIYSTVDACITAQEMWVAIERLQQGESLNKQDVKTNLFWEFGKFTSRDRESNESCYLRFYNMMNEMRHLERSCPPNDVSPITHWRSKNLAGRTQRRNYRNVDELRTTFISRFFSQALFDRLLGEIRVFSQHENESLTDTWLRMKEMLRNCHGHNLSNGNIIKIFYHGLNEITQEVLNAAAGAEGSSNSDTNKIMARMDAITMKMDAQYKDFQSRSKQPNLDDDDIPMSRKEEAKFMQTFRRTCFYNDYRNRDSNCDNWHSSGRNDYN